MATFLYPEMEVCLYAIFGAVSATATVTVARPVPPGPVATTVSTDENDTTVGVPEMMPLEVLRLRPVGRGVEPDIAKLVMEPEPVTTTVSGVITTFFVPEMLERLYTNAGDVSDTAIVTVARPVPPGPVAITVSTVEDDTAVGVPLMIPFEVLRLRPVGSGVEDDIA